jgi:hypothetical protein
MENKENHLEIDDDEIISKYYEEKTLLPSGTLLNIHEDLISVMNDFLANSDERTMSKSNRRRLLGSGIRRYGFIDQVSDVAADNPKFTPSYMNVAALKELIRQIEMLRNISITLKQMVRMNSDLLLLTGDEAYHIALIYYNSVKDAAKRRVPGAETIFRMLQPFFHNMRRTKHEPTEKQVLRDAKALLHGKKDGKVIIENERPHLVGGKHKVVDELAGGHVEGKITE